MASSSDFSAPKRFYSAVLFVFAAVGFLGSVATIYGVLQYKEARLNADVYPSRLKFPYYFNAALGPDFKDNGRAFINMLKREICDQKQSTGLKTKSDEKDGSKSHACKHIEDIQFASDQISDIYYSSGMEYDISLTNKGNTKASGIKVRSGEVIFLNVFSGSDRINIEYDKNSSTYSLPDLNPGETYKIEVWQKGRPYTYNEVYDFDVPKISFDGPAVNINIFNYTPNYFFTAYDFIRDMGFIFSSIIVLFICFIVGICIIFIIAVIDALVKGKPIASVFKTEKMESA